MFLKRSIVASKTLSQDLSFIFFQSKNQDFLSTFVRITSFVHHRIHTTVSHSQSQILSLELTTSGLESIIFLFIS
jgi:hypothetical protein